MNNPKEDSWHILPAPFWEASPHGSGDGRSHQKAGHWMVQKSFLQREELMRVFLGHQYKAAKEEIQSDMLKDAANSQTMGLYFVALLRRERQAESRRLSVIFPPRSICRCPWGWSLVVQTSRRRRRSFHKQCHQEGFWVLGFACNLSNLGCSYTGKVAMREITRHKEQQKGRHTYADG